MAPNSASVLPLTLILSTTAQTNDSQVLTWRGFELANLNVGQEDGSGVLTRRRSSMASAVGDRRQLRSTRSVRVHVALAATACFPNMCFMLDDIVIIEI